MYATTHPWEDFAETWAHYLHIVDTLETAGAFGLKVKPRRARGDIAAEIDFDPYRAATMEALIDAWLPIEFATNSLNRSMGLTGSLSLCAVAQGDREAGLHPCS